MSMLKIKCPECGAGLKSASGFTVGQTVPCPKCETYFSVEEPEEEGDEEEPRKAKPAPARAAAGAKKPLRAAVADDEDGDEDDAPRKKKKRKGDQERSYKNSPLRFAILGVLLLVLGVLATLFVMKKMKEREVADEGGTTKPEPATPPPGGFSPPPKSGPQGAKLPAPGGKRPNPGKGGNVNPPPADPLGGLIGGGPASPAEAQKLTAKYRAALVGTWTADLGNGVTEELTYAPDGTYTATRRGSAPASATGKYAVTGLVGTRGLKLELTSATGTRKVSAVFEGDELEHPTLQPGLTGTFRKK